MARHGRAFPSHIIYGSRPLTSAPPAVTTPRLLLQLGVGTSFLLAVGHACLRFFMGSGA